MRNKLFLFLAFVFCSLAAVKAQNIQLIANPDASTGLGTSPILYNGNMYFQYQMANGNWQLAKYDGTSVSLIANPDAGAGLSYNTSIIQIVYNGNLYFQYKNSNNTYQLAKYNGTSVSLIANPDLGPGIQGSLIEYNSNLYFQYQNANYDYQLAKYDGTSISLVSNPDAGQGFFGSPIVYNSNLYIRYYTASSSTQLAKYDGTSISVIPIAADGYVGNPIIYNGNLLFQTIRNKLAKYNGTSISVIANPDAGIGFQNSPIVYNGNLYFMYTETAGSPPFSSPLNYLAKYNDTAISLIPNLPYGNGHAGSPIIYNGNLYFKYSISSFQNYLAKYDGTSLSIIYNTAYAGYSFNGTPIVYNGNLYFAFNNSLAKFDGTSISVISKPNTSIWGNFIQFGSTLYFPVSNSVGNHQLAKLNNCKADTIAASKTICASQLPYTYLGHTMTKAGNDTLRLTNAGGCDSLAILKLNVKQANSSTISLTICSTQLPYSYLGHTMTKAANDTLHLTNAGGCDSLAILKLTVNTPTKWYLDFDGDGYYYDTLWVCFNPQGFWNQTSTLGFDCDENNANVWRTNSLYVDADGDGYSASIATVCYGNSIPTGYSLTTKGTDCDDTNTSVWQSSSLYVDTDSDGYDAGTATVCYGSSTPSGYSSTTTGSDCDDNDSSVWQSGLYYLDADGDGYNAGSGKVSVCYGRNIPSIYTLTTNGNDCNDNNAAITTGTTWYRDADNDGYGNPAIHLVACSNPSNGRRGNYVSNSTDCNDNNALANLIPTSRAGIDRTICYGDSVQIGDTSTANNTYYWYSGYSISNNRISNPKVAPKMNYTYILLAITPGGCRKFDTMKITVNPLPIANAGIDKFNCQGSQAIIGTTGRASTTYQWTPGGTSPNKAITKVYPTAPTSYVLAATSTITGCVKRDTVIVTPASLPIVDAGLDKSVCAGDSVQIGGASQSNVTYIWGTSWQIGNKNAINTKVSPTNTRSIILYGTNTITGCRNKDTVTIKVNPLPIANAGLDKTINAGQNVQIGTNAISGMSYLWTPSLNLSSSTIAKPIANPTSTTNYIVKVTNDITRCYKQDSMVLTVNGLPRLSSHSSETKTTILVEKNSNDMMFNLSPNPANNIVNLSYEIAETEANVKLKLLDINGQLLKEIVIDTPQLKGEINLDLSELVSGVYFINLQSFNQTSIKKLVVQK